MASGGLAVRLLTGNATRTTLSTASYDATPVPTARELHMLSRMGCGFSVSSFQQMRAAGDEMAWFEQQLDPSSVTESAKGDAVRSWFPDLWAGADVLWQRDRSGAKKKHEFGKDLSNYSLLRRIYSARTVHESMVELWSNHFSLTSLHMPGFTQRPAYDDMIRAHALGKFEDLLVAVSLHPAMLLYLDNWKSVRNNPNENQGRELLELHTVGRSAGYTETMVKDSAKLLSGHTVRDGTWGRFYDLNRHTTGAVSVLGFNHSNTTSDNPALAEEYIRYLARLPATARRVARKLAVRFVSDSPSDALVSDLAGVYLSTGSDIKSMLRALVASEEFWASAGQKVRTPIDDVVATCRVLQINASAPSGGGAFVHELSGTLKSTFVHQWPTPDGPPDQASAWASTSRMLNSWRVHWGMAGGYYPDGDVVYKAPASWLPVSQLRFDMFVDHLSRVVLGRRSTDQLLQAAGYGVNVGPGELITTRHNLVRYKMGRLLAVLLDSPAHMTR